MRFKNNLKRWKRQGAPGKCKCFIFFDHHFDVGVLADELVFVRASPVHHLKVEELNTVVLGRECCWSVWSRILVPSCGNPKLPKMLNFHPTCKIPGGAISPLPHIVHIAVCPTHPYVGLKAQRVNDQALNYFKFFLCLDRGKVTPIVDTHL